ncbi:MAG: hypothetical protein IID08_03530 [Candidatus Hydrogenedentes bacterium]|nr:hypothetical protein [Candidatus Hydrogenedentota bacterium]
MVIGAFIVVGGMLVTSRLDEQRIDRLEEELNGPIESARIVEIRSTRYDSPDSALATVMAVLSDPADEQERASAQEIYPDILGLCFYERLEADRFEDAEYTLKRLEREMPNHHEYTSARRRWGESLRKRCRNALELSDEEEAERLFARIVEEEYLCGDTNFLQEVQKDKIDRWIEARERGDEAEAKNYLVDAAGMLISATPKSRLTDAIYRSDWTGREMYDMAEQLWADGRKERSIPFYQAARRRLNDGNPEQFGKDKPQDYDLLHQLMSKIEGRTVDALVYAGDELADGNRVLITTRTPLELYRDAASNTHDEALKLTPLRRKLDTEIAALYEITKPLDAFKIASIPEEGYLSREQVEMIYELSHDARRESNNILDRTGFEVWSALLADEQFDPWTLVDSRIIDAVDEKAGVDADETTRRKHLLRLARSHEYPVPVPELLPAREMFYEVLARWGLLYVDGNPEEGFRMIRMAMRNTEQDWLREDLEHALRTLVRNSREAKDFEALYELAGFYAAEVGISDRHDPFRDEFRRTLQAGAKVFRERSEMKYIFMQTLLAEIFPDEAIGQLAREEAIRLGFKAVATVGEQDGTNEFAPPSHLDGLSVIAVDNSTEYHLLAFYDGPETFFVRFGPYRKGSVVLKDGMYRVAVIAPTGNIRPYRARVSLNSEQGEVVYRIEESRSDGNAWTSGNMAWGEYTLLRKPSETGSLTIDADTGSATVWRTAKEAM